MEEGQERWLLFGEVNHEYFYETRRARKKRCRSKVDGDGNEFHHRYGHYRLVDARQRKHGYVRQQTALGGPAVIRARAHAPGASSIGADATLHHLGARTSEVAVERAGQSTNQGDLGGVVQAPP